MHNPSNPSRRALVTLLFIAAGALPTVRAQVSAGEEQLLFTTLHTERTATSTYPNPIPDRLIQAHAEVLPNDIHLLRHGSGGAVAPAFLPHLGICEVLGDHDGDGQFYESGILGSIDALVHPRDPQQGGRLVLDQSRVFYSPTEATADTSGNILRPSEVGRFLPGGTLEHLYDQAQLEAAIGGSSPVANVDAAALCPIYECGGFVGMDLFLSFEGTLRLWVPGVGFTILQDGGVLRVPYDAITLAASPHDGAALIVAMDTASAEIAYSESDINAILTGSIGSLPIASNAAGSAVTSIGDLDGLTTGAQVARGSGICPLTGCVLWFTGENLTGCGVVTTDGKIAKIGSNLLARPAHGLMPTTGSQLGLANTSGTLNALARAPVGARVVTLDSHRPKTNGFGSARISYSITPPVASTVIVMWNTGCAAPGCVDGLVGSSGWNGFPELYVPTSGMMASSLGTVSAFSWSSAASWNPSMVGIKYVVQLGVYNSYGNFLSNPILFEY